MSHGVLAWGRFNPPTEEGHGKLVKAVQDHAEKVGGQHYIFPTHTQDKKKNPLTHEHKVGAMRQLFPGANVVSHDKVRTIIDAMKHMESKGHKEVTVVAGSDRIDQYHKMLNQYRSKEYPKIKKVNVVSAGHRDPDAEGAEGMSASKLRGLVAAGKKKEFISHYSDKKLGSQLHDKIKAGMQMESVAPVGIFLLGGPGSGKDYVLKNIFSRFDLTEVQVEHILNGAAAELIEQNKNIVINGALDESQIESVKTILEGYDFDSVYVHVTNKVSRLRNSLRDNPLPENKRLEKWYRAEKLAENMNTFKFNNSINLNESSEFEKVFFADQIEKILSHLIEFGLLMQEISEAKTFAPVAKHKSGLPKKYVAGLSDKTAAARKAHWKKMSKYSDRDPRAYEPAPGDATAKTKLSQYTKKYRAMYGEQVEADVKKPHTIENIAKKHKVDVSVIEKALEVGKKVEREHTNDESTAEIIALAHLWERPDYYKMLSKMEQKIPVTPADHAEAERKDQIRRDRRDWRILHHQNRHIHQAAKASMSEAEEKPLPVKLRRAPRSGNITAVMDKRKETGRVDESAADKSLAAKSEKSGVPLRILKAVYRRGVAAWNSGHRPGTTPAQWGHARVNSYITKGKTYHTADKDLREEEQIDEMDKSQPSSSRGAEGLALGKKANPVKSDKVKSNALKILQKQYKKVKEEVEQISEEPKTKGVFWIRSDDSSGKRDYIRRTDGGRMFSHNEKGHVHALSNHAFNHKGGKEDKEREVRKILNYAKNSEHAAQLMNKSKLGHSNWKPEAHDKDSSTQKYANEEVDIDELFEMQLVGTDEYRKHAIAMTPGQGEPVDAFPVKSPNKKPIAVPAKKGKSVVSQYTEHTNCGTPDCCGECASSELNDGGTSVSKFAEEKEKDGKEDGVDFTPTANVKKLKKGDRTPGNMRFAYLDGLPVVTARVNEAEAIDPSTMSSPPGFNYKSGKTLSLIRKSMPVPRQVPAPPGGHPVPPGYKRVRDHIAGWKLVKEDDSELTLQEAVQYHTENNISFTENVFRPGSEMFFQMIGEAKKLYSEGKYEPKDEWEEDMLQTDIGEKAIYEGQEVILDYPFEEELNEADDPTDGKGIGKPWREGSGGAVYVRDGGSIRKIRFSQSGMKKKYMDPSATRSFVARHRCLTNKDRTSASYWACRWPRFFSNSGKVWW